MKNIKNIHEFFYEQSNYKVGASENNLKLEFKEKNKKWFNKNYFKNTSDKNIPLSIKKFEYLKYWKKARLNLISYKKLFILYQLLALY